MSFGGGNFVVPAAKELHETEPVAEWINHQRQPTPTPRFQFPGYTAVDARVGTF
jgi:hypothetical protein